MLSFFDQTSLHRPIGRRAFLQLGSAALGGLLLPSFLSRGRRNAVWGAPADANAAASAITGKSVIFLFMQGGPPQFETFDPKIDLPVEMRTVGGTVPTSIPGVHFGSSLPRLAKLAHKLAIVRNFVTETDHGGLRPIVSSTTGGASLGALYSRIAGMNNPKTALPTSMALWPVSVDKELTGPQTQFGNFAAPGPLGAAYAPTTPGAGGAYQENMRLNLSRERMQDRRHLLTSIDSLKRGLDDSGDSVGQLQRQAYDMILNGVADSFDLSREDPRLIERYDTSGYYNPRNWDNPAGGKPLNNGKQYTAHAKTLGKLLLLARRLAEAGCGFITVNTDFVWDFHADINNVAVEMGKKAVIDPFDHAVSAFIEDCEARGLGNKILLVCCGEMGRTPRLNKGGGRDHWPALAPLILYGGGLTHGQVIGRSTRDGGAPDGSAMKPDNLLATIFQTLFDQGQLRLVPGLPNVIKEAASAMDQTTGVI